MIVLFIVAVDGAIVDARQEKLAKSTEQSFAVDDFYAQRAAILAAEASEFLGADEVLDADEERARDALNYAEEDALDFFKDFLSGGGDCLRDTDCNAYLGYCYPSPSK